MTQHRQYDLTREHWIETKEANETMILSCKLKTIMAKAMIELCNKKIAEFPKPLNKAPLK